MFDEVLGIYVPRAEFEKRARFNSDDYKPTKEEIRRFPSRLKEKKVHFDISMDLTPAITSFQNDRTSPKLKPPGYRIKS